MNQTANFSTKHITGKPGSLPALDWHCHQRRERGAECGTWHDTATVRAYIERQPVGPFAFNQQRWEALFKKFYDRCFGCNMFDDFLQRDVFWHPVGMADYNGLNVMGFSPQQWQRTVLPLYRAGVLPSVAARRLFQAICADEEAEAREQAADAQAWRNLAATGDPAVSVAEYYAAERMAA